MNDIKNFRILTIDSEEYDFYDQGAYADVFVNKSRSRCWKVFKLKEPLSVSHESFESEMNAYELSKEYPVVADMVPQLFRSKNLNLQIVDQLGNDVSSHYIGGLNYEMEFLDLEFCKIGLRPIEETQSIRKIFKEAGINYISDASIAFDINGDPKLIDFGIQEIEVWHEP